MTVPTTSPQGYDSSNENNTAWLSIPKATLIRSPSSASTVCAGHPDELIRLLKKYPIPGASRLEYGTAGFRYDADILPPVMVRVGIFCALFHKHFMVTASHNDESYNGVKLCNNDGSMLTSPMEALLTELVNFSTTEQVLDWIQQQHSKNNKNSSSTTTESALLHTGRDTRSHSPALQHLAILAAQRTDTVAIMNHGVVTTPMLHHVVLHAHATTQLPLLSSMIPLRPFLGGYYDILVQSYLALLQTATPHQEQDSSLLHAPLVVDCACGVGYEHVLRLNAIIQDKFGVHQNCDVDKFLQRPRLLIASNGPDDGPLNQDCGSEHIQKERALPKIYNSNVSYSSIPYACALDGDADRIVFFSNHQGELILLDGDKISCLIAKFLQEQFSAVQDAVSGDVEFPTLGVVQTAYANGASTQYLNSILPSKESVILAKTGVKHVHHKAVECCDVGVYFEANGHGTVVFGPKYFDFLYQAERSLRASHSHGVTSDPINSVTAAAHVAMRRLQLLPSLINQAVGDALSDLLLVDLILTFQRWTLQDWNQAMYTDLSSVQSKVQVPDRNMIVTNDTETRCVKPPELQAGLDEAMEDMNDGAARCFVRPSGTENVVRIYAEAGTLAGAQRLAQRALQVVQKVTKNVQQQSKM